MKYYPRVKNTYKQMNPVIWWLPVIVWMLVIFFLSHQSGLASSSLSSGITQTIWEILNAVLPFEIDLHQFHGFIRKLAHFASYFILGMFCINAVTLTSKTSDRYRLLANSVFICILYAISDEIHQLFVPGRSGSVFDVLIDSSGALMGCLLYIFAMKTWPSLRNE